MKVQDSMNFNEERLAVKLWERQGRRVIGWNRQRREVKGESWVLGAGHVIKVKEVHVGKKIGFG
jgi:hypothetical protein